MAFAPPSYEQPSATSGAAMKRSIFYTEILKYSFSRPEDCDYLEALLDWLDGNVFIPGGVAQQLRDKLRDERAKLRGHPLSGS
jgi:hypothetical protein